MAIVALFPRNGIQKSVIRLIDGLISSEFSVLVVMNQSDLSNEWLLSLSGKPIEILTRPNIGRDFGAFKIGYLHAKKNEYLANTDNLVFANDSVFYGPRTAGFLESMLKVDLPWHAMFVNYQHHTHAQSFFQKFNKIVFKEKEFSKFWQKFNPSELRHLAIIKGEVGLSSTCIKLGHVPHSFVNSRSILENPHFVNFTPDEKFGIWSNYGLSYLDHQTSSLENTVFLMQRQYLQNNVTHHQGLLASRVLKAPLKLDILKSGQTTIEGLRDTLASLGLDQAEIQEVFNVFLTSGTHASSRGLKKLWGDFGFV